MLEAGGKPRFGAVIQDDPLVLRVIIRPSKGHLIAHCWRFKAIRSNRLERPGGILRCGNPPAENSMDDETEESAQLTGILSELDFSVGDLGTWTVDKPSLNSDEIFPIPAHEGSVNARSKRP